MEIDPNVLKTNYKFLVMKILKKIICTIITVFFVILFSYAVISKAGNFEYFRNQLEQAPGLQRFGETLAYSILVLQVTAIFLLCYEHSRLWGLCLTFGMVTVFAGYIALIQTDSKNLPCTCIGLFEKMTWKDNLVLNLGLMITALTGILTMKAGRSK
ncbi:hypothetical protein Q73A0000_05835 [Kaistella flava (ex Peng et al. 2021)]|uniref:Methylamine utilisation protein MauE domain-containing protein n=1 Tax=Kaistella flava (ex Peng et al. 2021) TaxID=2038776 RepID=A0A7M2Y8B5_9FLAO|nr:MauE/DoxX family redox-associated membrane protein [Kaistella flava (ex Peng et al. 2021)]QOW09914.1 hypothetical protein Q73A0000_05835 [Kaistella flava (ex Peng et al. 2021)]